MDKITSVTLTGFLIASTYLGTAVAAEIDSSDAATSENYRPVCETVTGATATNRELGWDGSDHLGLAVRGGHASYTPNGDNKIHVSGDAQLLAHLRVRHGSLELDCEGGQFDTSNLVVALPGREFKEFAIVGATNVSLRKLHQEQIKLALAGSGTIEADGNVDHVVINIANSGDANLTQVIARTEYVNLAGNGSADIAPVESADINIAGSGDVTLHTNPPHVETHVVGSGRVRNVSPGG